MSHLKEEKQPVSDSTVILKMFADYESVLSAHRDLLQPRSRLQQQLDECADKPSSSTSTADNFRSSSGGCSFRKNLELRRSQEDASRKRMSDAELISANCKVARLEMKVCDMETNSSEAKIRLEKQIEAMRLEHEVDKHRREELEMKLVRTLQDETNAKEELVELKRKSETEMNALNTRLKRLEEERDELKERYDEETSQLNEAVFVLESDVNRLQLEKESLNNELECCEEKVKRLSNKAIELQRLLQEEADWKQEKDMLTLRIKELENELTKHEDDIELTKILRTQVASMPELEVENRRLKEENRLFRLREDNVLLLREQLKTAEATIERFQHFSSEVSRLKNENEVLKSQIAEWRNISLVGRSNEPRSAVEVSKVVAELQLNNSLTLEKIGDLTSQNNVLKKSKEQAEDELKSLRMRCQKQEESLKQNAEHIRHVQRKFILVSKERDLNRQLMDSYEKDLSINMTALNSEKITKLEFIVEGYRKTVENLETDLNTARNRLINLGFKSKEEAVVCRNELELQVKTMKLRVSELESRVSELNETNKALELRLEFETVKGEYNPAKTRLVHLRSNPAAWLAEERANELQILKKENVALKERVKLLEEEGAKAQDVTLRVAARLEQVSPEQVIEDLKQQLVSADLQKDRVKETFKRFSSEIREVTYRLLGYKMEQPCSKNYKLSSIYADSPNDYLLFSKSEDGSMQLLETPYSAYLTDKIELYLHTQQSIPAFLSSITLELSSQRSCI